MADNSPATYLLVGLGCAVGLGALIYAAHKHTEDLDEAWKAHLDSRKLHLSTHESHSLIPQEPLASAVSESATFTFLSPAPHSTTSTALPILAQDHGLPTGNGTSYSEGGVRFDLIILDQGVPTFAEITVVVSCIAALLFSLLMWAAAERRAQQAEDRVRDMESRVDETGHKYELILDYIIRLEQKNENMHPSLTDDLLAMAEISAPSEEPRSRIREVAQGDIAAIDEQLSDQVKTTSPPEPREEMQTDLPVTVNIDVVDEESSPKPSDTPSDYIHPCVDEVDDIDLRSTAKSATFRPQDEPKGLDSTLAEAVDADEDAPSGDLDEGQDEDAIDPKADFEDIEASVMEGDEYIKKNDYVGFRDTKQRTAEEESKFNSAALRFFGRSGKSEHQIQEPEEEDGVDDSEREQGEDESSEEEQSENEEREDGENDNEESEEEESESGDDEETPDDETDQGDRDGANMPGGRSGDSGEGEADESRSESGNEDDDGDEDDFHGAGGGTRQAAVTAEAPTEVQPVDDANLPSAAEVKVDAVFNVPTNTNGASADIAAAPANVPRQTSSLGTGSETQSTPLSTATAIEPTPAPTPTVPQPALPACHNGRPTPTPSRSANISPVAPSFTPRPGAQPPKSWSVPNGTRIPTPIAGGINNTARPQAAKPEPQQNRAPQPIQHGASTSAAGLDASLWALPSTPDSSRRFQVARGPIHYNNSRQFDQQQTPASGGKKRRGKPSQWRRKEWYDKDGEMTPCWRHDDGVLCWDMPRCITHDNNKKSTRPQCSPPEGFDNIFSRRRP